MPVRIVLASGSPRRKKILRDHGIRFRVEPSGVSERGKAGLSPAALVKMLALRKALFVARRNPNDVVLGADTIVFINGKVVGKPRNAAHGRRMLAELSGVWQKVYTGVAVVSEGGKRRAVDAAVSRVKMKKLTPEEIERASRKHLDKAGGYAVQERKDAFVERIEGDYDNVVGLPMRVVKRLLRRLA